MVKKTSQPLKIAQVAPLFESVPPKLYGGTERVVSFLTEELVEQGHDVTLFASGDSVTKAKLVAACPESLRLCTNCVDQIAHHIRMLQLVQDVKEQFDIIHYHIDYFHFPLSRLSLVPNVTTLHGRLDIPDLQPLYQTFNDMPVISISDSQRQPLPDVNWVGNVYHGLPANLFTPNYRDGKYLAFLGRISKEKRVDRAIEIAKRCGIPLKIAAKIDATDQDYYDSEIRQLMDHPLIEFVGEINEAEKEKFLGEAQALLFPIDWAEPFGLVMIEAMACGTPVIAYRRGSVPEVIQEGVSGFIVDTEDQAVQAIHNLSKLDRRKCRNVFDESFTSQQMAKNYLKVFHRLIETKMIRRAS